ncbi:MAG: hypothetical protein N0A24_11935 [Armatimonadetes bacterium]|nr:hypothetical protein [Armatimonadota bacterium]MDW8154879.1 hypothetical protein [Armatimonadota bacterium]
MARYGERAFVINPPAPVLFVLPFVAVFGTATNQTIISAAVGASAVGLFWVATRRLGWDPVACVLTTWLVAFGTNLWWASTDGSLWTFAHAAAVFFLMAALAEAAGRGRPWLVGMLVGLGGLSRLPTFLTFPLFAYLLTREIQDPGRRIRALVAFGLGLGAMAALYLLYNFARFGTVLDLGYYHPQYFQEPWFTQGRFDLRYVPRHIHAILFAGPVFSNSFPFVRPSLVGMGLFLTTPAFLYAFRCPLRGLSGAAAVATALTAIPLVTYGITGWSQFGYRFSLDVLPMLAILTKGGLGNPLRPLPLASVAASTFINLWGTLSFNRLGWAV